MNREMPPLTLQHCSQILEVLEGDEGIAAFAEPVDVIEVCSLFARAKNSSSCFSFLLFSIPIT